jgi:hypothetical protein
MTTDVVLRLSPLKTTWDGILNERFALTLIHKRGVWDIMGLEPNRDGDPRGSNLLAKIRTAPSVAEEHMESLHVVAKRKSRKKGLMY